jgi:hypothetical protein
MRMRVPPPLPHLHTHILLSLICIAHGCAVSNTLAFLCRDPARPLSLPLQDARSYVAPCRYHVYPAAYTSRNLACPDTIGSNAKFDHLTIESLLLAAGVPHGSLDSLLDTDLPTNDRTWPTMPAVCVVRECFFSLSVGLIP